MAELQSYMIFTEHAESVIPACCLQAPCIELRSGVSFPSHLFLIVSQGLPSYFFFFFNLILFFNFTILYWFCHISTWIHHRNTHAPHPEHSSLLPPHSIPLGHPSAPAPSIQYHAFNLDWWLVSYMILYMFQCHSPKSSHPLPLHRVHKTVLYISVSFAVSYTGLLLPSF